MIRDEDGNVWSKDWCRGFCRTCGTSCARYNEDGYKLIKDLQEAQVEIAKLRKAVRQALKTTAWESILEEVLK